MAELLAQFGKDANAIGSTPEEAIGQLLKYAGKVYAVQLSGAVTQKEKRRAWQTFINVTANAMEGLPTAAEDARIDAALKAKGLL